MRYFPIFLDVKARTIIVVGGGEEALRKLRLLGRTGARITVVADGVDPEIAAMPQVSRIDGPFAPSMLEGAILVVSADPAQNRAVAEAAALRGIPCNCVDRPGLSSFIMPSIVDRSPVIVAIGTEGTAPVLGQGLRAKIEATLPSRLGELATAAAGLRGRIARELPAGGPRRAFWRRFFFGPARDAFLADRRQAHASIVETLIAGGTDAQGAIAFVSAGGGDPELLTLKAHRLLQEADVIVHDAGMPDAIFELARRDASRLKVNRNDFTTTADILLAALRRGLRVVRLHMGAVSVEERAAVAAEAVAVDIVPGVAEPESAAPLPSRQSLRQTIEALKVAS
jgi:uroporphyrin-III C-methyltransferase/precorrin-2 dehydrogenase/sirohydrochlorin ferrochelatase